MSWMPITTRLTLLSALLLLAAGCHSLRSTGSSSEALPTQDEAETSWRDYLTAQGVKKNVKQALGKGPDESVARAHFKEGEALFHQAVHADEEDQTDLFNQAAKEYAAAAERWPDSMLEEDGLFMQGECYFFTDNYGRASTLYGDLMKKYPNTRHVDRVDARRFDIGQYWLAMHHEDPKFFLSPNWADGRLPTTDTYGNAVRLFDKIRLDDPTGRLADDATMAAGVAYFDRGKFRDADRFFSDLRTTYPESDHYFDASLRSVKAKLEIYQGSEYDSAALVEAEEIIDLLFRRFPERAEEHRQYLEEAFREIRLRMASRDWELARFYDNRQEYGGARFYYSKVIRDFADTSLAADAHQRMEEIRDRPDKPPERAKWLTDNLPKPKNQGKPLLSSDSLRWLRR